MMQPILDTRLERNDNVETVFINDTDHVECVRHG